MVLETDPEGVNVSGARALVPVRWAKISSEDEVRGVLNWGCSWVGSCRWIQWIGIGSSHGEIVCGRMWVWW